MNVIHSLRMHISSYKQTYCRYLYSKILHKKQFKDRKVCDPTSGGSLPLHQSFGTVCLARPNNENGYICTKFSYKNRRHMLNNGYQFGRRGYSTADRRKSALFVSDANPRENAPVDIDLNLENLLSSPDKLQTNLTARNINLNIFSLLNDYEEMKKLGLAKTKLENERNEIATRMAALVKVQLTSDVKQSKEILIQRGKGVKQSLKEIMKKWWDTEEKVFLQCLQIPNIIHRDTQMEKTVLRTSGETKDFPEVRSHIEVGRDKNLIKFSNIGPKTFYLTGELVSLERKLINSTRHYLRQTGLCPFSSPDIYKSVIMEGSGVDSTDKNQVLTLQANDRSEKFEQFLEDSHIEGASLHSFIAHLTKMKVRSSSLPLQYFTIGRHYCPGANLPGLYGALQTTKAIIFGGCLSQDQSVELLEKYTELIWSYLSLFNIPIRLVSVAAPVLSPAQSLQYKFELWSPSLQQFIQVSSLAVYGEYISRRLMCIHDNNEAASKYIHMIGGDMLNITRLLALSLEYNKNTEIQTKLSI